MRCWGRGQATAALQQPPLPGRRLVDNAVQALPTLLPHSEYHPVNVAHSQRRHLNRDLDPSGTAPTHRGPHTERGGGGGDEVGNMAFSCRAGRCRCETRRQAKTISLHSASPRTSRWHLSSSTDQCPSADDPAHGKTESASSSHLRNTFVPHPQPLQCPPPGGGQDIKDPYGTKLRSAPRPWCGPWWRSRQSPPPVCSCEIPPHSPSVQGARPMAQPLCPRRQMPASMTFVTDSNRSLMRFTTLFGCLKGWVGGGGASKGAGAQPAYAVFHPLRLKNGDFRNRFF